MIIRRVNMMHELKQLAHGKKSHLPVEIIAGWALRHVVIEEMPTPARRDEVRWLNALYALKDLRPQV